MFWHWSLTTACTLQVRLIVAWVLGPILFGIAIAIYTRTGMLQFTLVGGNKILMSESKPWKLPEVECIFSHVLPPPSSLFIGAYQFRSFTFMLTLFNLQLVVSELQALLALVTCPSPNPTYHLSLCR